MFSVCYITAPSKAVAVQLANLLVRQHRVAACVNLFPRVTSIYEWDGTLCEDEECLMMVKTRTECVPALTQLVKDHHPYDRPEVIAVPIQDGMGSAAYLTWVHAQTSPLKTGAMPTKTACGCRAEVILDPHECVIGSAALTGSPLARATHYGSVADNASIKEKEE